MQCDCCWTRLCLLLSLFPSTWCGLLRKTPSRLLAAPSTGFAWSSCPFRCFWCGSVSSFDLNASVAGAQDYILTGGLVTVIAQIETCTLGYLLLRMLEG